ncbi:MAG: dTMP kinase [Pirellulaceae bacterium]
MQGKLLSVDGIDGCGKSTQIRLLGDWLETRGHEVVHVRDPGGTTLGENLREILLHRKEIAFGMRAEMLMYMSSRAQMVEEVMSPALEAGKVVLADRFLLANVVYQGSAGGLPTDIIWSVGAVATRGLEPDFTAVLDLSPETASARMGPERDRLESRGVEYMTRVREGFLEQAKQLGEKVQVFDATESVEQIHTRITDQLALIV